MCKRILLSALAAGTMLMGVGMADAAEFIFRYQGKSPQVAMATPEEPEEPDVFDVSKLTVASGGRGFAATNGIVSIGDTFWGQISIVNPGAAGTIQIWTSGIAPGFEAPWAPSTVACVLAAHATTVCEHTIEITQAHIDYFCGTDTSGRAGQSAQYSPSAYFEGKSDGNGSESLLTNGQYATVIYPSCG